MLKEKKHHTCVIFLDLKKAFDTVDHKLLLKLQKSGIRGNALSLFQDYLSNRQQYVTLNDVTSSTKTIKCGVPQGVLFWDQLYLLYILMILFMHHILQQDYSQMTQH